MSEPAVPTPVRRAELDIVTVTYNSPALPPEFESLAKEEWVHLFVVDNGSDHLPWLPPEATLVENGANVGFGVACNRVLEFGSSPYVLFLNPDCRIDVEAVGRLLDIAHSHPRVLVGPRTIGAPGQRVLPAGAEPSASAFLRQYLGLARRFGGGFNRYEAEVPARNVRVDWVGGGCLLMPREVFTELGGFDHAYFMYGEDVDLCLRARDAGAAVLLAGDVLASHPVGTGSTASTHLRMAWLRNLRRIVERRRGPWARRRLDVVLAIGAAQISLLRLRGRQPTLGRPDVEMLRRHVWVS